MKQVFFGHPIYLGIYSIRNIETGKILFGKSHSCRLDILNIITQCETGIYPNVQFQKDFTKYGKKGFEYKVHEVLTTYTKKERDNGQINCNDYNWNLELKLKYWLAKSKKNKVKVYNTSSSKKFVVLIDAQKLVVFKSSSKKEICKELDISLPTLNTALSFNNKFLKYKYNNLFPILEKDYEERKDKLTIMV